MFRYVIPAQAGTYPYTGTVLHQGWIPALPISLKFLLIFGTNVLEL